MVSEPSQRHKSWAMAHSNFEYSASASSVAFPQDSKSQQESCAASMEVSNRDSTKKSYTSIQKPSPNIES
jgi:hypothetical protein